MKKKRKYVIIFTIILAFLITFCFLGPHIIGRIYEGVPVIGTYMNTKNGNHMIFIDEKIYFISPKSEKPMFKYLDDRYVMSSKAGAPMFSNLETGDKIFAVLDYAVMDSSPPRRGANFCIKLKSNK